MAISATSREVISDCLTRLSSGDACAAFDLASEVMAHADSKDIELNLAIVEALAMVSRASGCGAAAIFMDSQWDDMKKALRKRWARNGMIG